MKTFEALISDIAAELGPTSGLDCEEIDHRVLISLMEKYQSNESDWTQYALADPSRLYTRNLVADTNKKSNILVVVWNPGKGTPIHDHANAHCVMKILKGTLKESVFSSPETGDLQPPKHSRTSVYGKDEVTYISDKIGLHKIENGSATEMAVSLHLYTPPHAHNHGFNFYDEQSGKRVHIKRAPLYSDRGTVLAGNLLAKMGNHRHTIE